VVHDKKFTFVEQPKINLHFSKITQNRNYNEFYTKNMHAIYNKTLSYKLYEFTANYCRSQYAPVIATNTDVTMWVKKDNYAYL